MQLDHSLPQKNITDIRSWFGIINQVSGYAQLREIMEPFRKFLSPKNKFYWDSELQSRFERSKDVIIRAIQDGIHIFDVKRPTCLRTDWSCDGIGYFLLQKHCSCASRLPDCCRTG